MKTLTTSKELHVVKWEMDQLFFLWSPEWCVEWQLCHWSIANIILSNEWKASHCQKHMQDDSVHRNIYIPLTEQASQQSQVIFIFAYVHCFHLCLYIYYTTAVVSCTLASFLALMFFKGKMHRSVVLYKLSNIGRWWSISIWHATRPSSVSSVEQVLYA